MVFQVFCSAIPVFEEEVKPVKTESIKTVEFVNFYKYRQFSCFNDCVTNQKEKLRQDEEDGVGEIEQVGEQVSQIINGELVNEAIRDDL